MSNLRLIKSRCWWCALTISIWPWHNEPILAEHNKLEHWGFFNPMPNLATAWSMVWQESIHSKIAVVIVVAHQSSGSTRQRNGYSCLNKDVEPHVYETRNRKKRYSLLNGGRYLWETMPVTISFRNYLPGNVMSSSKQEEIAMDCASVSYI